MKFRFCGDLDCPDWILSEMNTLSKMSSIKMKLLCQIVAKTLVGEPLDEESALKLLQDAKLDSNDMKACIPALNHILSYSARYEVEEDALSSELQQLGLPKEHATALCKVYSGNVKALTEKLASKSLRTSALNEVTCTPTDSSNVLLKMKVKDHLKNGDFAYGIAMSSDQLAILLKDLRSARGEMRILPS